MLEPHNLLLWSAVLALAAGLWLLVGGDPASVAFTCIAFGALLGAAAVLSTRAVAARHREIFELRNQHDFDENRIERLNIALDALADGLDVGIFLCDERGLVQFANRKVKAMFRADQPKGESILAITLSHELERLVTETIESRRHSSVEMHFTYPEDRIAIVQSWAEPPEWERVYVSIYDVTELRRLERIRQDFVANVSHEVRTPMTLIRAMAETLLDEEGGDRDPTRRYLERIIAEVDRLTLISQDLLVLSSAETGPVRKQACDVAAVVRGIVSLLGDKASKKSLTIRYEGPKHLLVEANSAQMSQVFTNLIDNAINYTVEGGIRVHLSADDEAVAIRVIDSGVGIEAEHLPRIFERFYRVDRARSRATGGTGLGLSIVRHIVESHGGKVGVESTPGEGTTFTVVLPIGAPMPTPDERDVV